MKSFAMFGIMACCLLFAPCVPMAHADDAVPIATGEWAPYSSEQAPGQGEVTKLVRKVFARLGRNTHIEFYPWKRCYKMVLEGKAWGAFPYSWTEGRAKEVLFSDPIGSSDSGWFYVGKPPLARYRSPRDVLGLRVGGVAGYFYEEALKKAGVEGIFAPDELSTLRMLLAGRVDLVPMNVLVARGLIATHFPDRAHEFKILDDLYSKNELCMIVSRSYPGARELLDAFNAALAEVDKDN